MENNIIAEYLNSRKIDAKQECSGIYVFRRPFTDNWGVKSVKTILFVIEGLIHVIIELPVQQINRDIGYRILSEICWINYELEPHQNYEYSATSRTLYFHSSVSADCSSKELSAIIDQSIEIVAEDIRTISGVVSEISTQWAIENMRQKRYEEPRRSCGEAERTLPRRPDTGVFSHWRNADSYDVISFSRLQEAILHESHGQIILMEGPTACGKSLAIRQLRERFPDRVAILTVEDIADLLIDIIMHRDESKFRAKIGNCDIVCFENIDMLRTSSTQNEAVYLFDKLAKQQKVIVLNGIECTKRTPIMLQRIKSQLQIFQFVQNDGE